MDNDYDRHPEFQPTLPARGATLQRRAEIADVVVFQPTLPARGATGLSRRPDSRTPHFNPRSPHGERRGAFQVSDELSMISTHAPRTGSDSLLHKKRAVLQGISTHAPRTGSDTNDFVTFLCVYDISTHAPRTGSDSRAASRASSRQQFQPTLPARGATRPSSRCPSSSAFQPTLPARGATCRDAWRYLTAAISTHAPRTGSDDGRRRTSAAAKDFNPRSPHGERRQPHGANAPQFGISTHAPRTGSDTIPLFSAFVQRHFNPRSPHGERHGFVAL